MSRLGTHKDVEKVARRARKQGWTVEVAKGSTHIVWTSPDGETQVRTSLTPRSATTVLGALRRDAGLT